MTKRRIPPKGGSCTAPPPSNLAGLVHVLWYRPNAKHQWKELGTATSEAGCTELMVRASKEGMHGDWKTLPAGERPKELMPEAARPGLFDASDALMQAALADQVAAYLQVLDRGRRTWDKADVMFAELLKVLVPGQVVAMPDGRRFELVDNFAHSNVAFKSAGVKRFELKKATERGAGAAAAGRAA
jgi:hypothetical protein